MFRLSVCVLMVTVLCGCDGWLVGGPCTYQDTPGVATIVSVETANPSDNNCPNDPVEVVFDFAPDDPDIGDLEATRFSLTISSGTNPPLSWVTAEGLEVGTQHPCMRRDITRGTCTPIIYTFTEVDYDAAAEQCYQETPAAFTMSVVPAEMNDTIVGQRCVLLVTVEDDPASSGDEEAVTITATANDADITIQPQQIAPGEVCEITVVPQDVGEIIPDDNTDEPYGQGHEILVEITGQRSGAEETATVSFNLLPGDDQLEPYATEMRDRFIPYLAANHPELGITEETPWTPSIVKPHILVVSHYLFFSEEWEMGLMWHIMIPPYDWTRIYLRHRYDHVAPQYGFEISSVAADPPEQPHEYEVPEEVDR
jgi:hypothetical protein